MTVQQYKDYASILGVILLDSACAIVMFYLLHVIFSIPNVWIGVVIVVSIITRTGLYEHYTDRD